MTTEPVTTEPRHCICADPENCTEAVPGYICRRMRRTSKPALTDDQCRDLCRRLQKLGVVGDTRRHVEIQRWFDEVTADETPVGPTTADNGSHEARSGNADTSTDAL